MSRDDILRMAREAGFVLSSNATDEAMGRFERFAALDAACAKLEAQRDELLEALNRMVCNPNAPNLAFARAAIAKCK